MRTNKTTHILRSLGVTLALISLLVAGAFYWKKHQETARHDQLTQTLKKNAETVRFMENKGQLPDKNVLYYFDTKQGAAYVERDKIRFIAYETEESDAQPQAANEKRLVSKPKKERIVKGQHSFTLNLAGSNPSPKVNLGKSYGTHYNYFLDQDSSKWVSGVQAAKDLTLEDVYPGVNLRLYSTDEGSLEFDWVMAPGADYNKVKMHFEGQDGLAVAEDGSLKVGLRFTDVKFHLPESYQVTDKGKQNVNFAFNKTDENTITFATDAKVDARYPLVIDPTLEWGTFFDGNGNMDEYLFAIQSDATTNEVYCAGATNLNIPTNAAPYNVSGYLNTITGLNGGNNTGRAAAVIYRINATGTALLDLTLFGSTVSSNSTFTKAYALSLSANKVFVGGTTTVDVPTTGGAFDTTRDGRDGWVAVFPRDLGTLNYATYIGGTGTDIGVTSIRAVDDSSFVIGATVNGALPAAYISAGAANSTGGGASDGYIARFTSFNALSYGTYVGGTGADTLNDIEVLAGGAIAFIGDTDSTLTEVNSAAASGSGLDFMLGVLNGTGTAFTYLDKIGGSGDDSGYDTDIYNSKIYFTGVTKSNNFPTSAGAFDTSFNGTSSMVVGSVDVAGSSNYLASYYGGTGDNLGNSIKVLYSSPCVVGNFPNPVVLVFGSTTATDLVTKNVNGESFYKSSYNGGGFDVIFAGFTADMSQLKYATYIGGSAADYLGETGVPKGANNLWFDGKGDVYVGTTTHSDVPFSPNVISGGFDLTKSNGSNDTHLIFKVDVTSLGVTDYSDAPASFGQPSHGTVCLASDVKLRLGALIDAEGGPFPTTGANGDDTNGSNDEDGVASPPTVTVGGPQTINVTVNVGKNTTGSTANLYAWIDLNSDGQFSANEFQSTTVANGFTGNKTLTWTNATISGATPKPYLRVRLTTDTLTDVAGTAAVDERSYLSATDGEVEDYLLTALASADLAITKTDSVGSVNAGGTTTYSIVVTNNGPSPANGAIFTDPAVTGLSATGVTCGGAAGGAVCPTAGNTTVVLMQGAGIVIPTLPIGGSVTFMVTANVTATSGSVTNTASIAPPAGVTDPTPGNNTASDTDTVTPVADLSINKTNNVTSVNAGGTTTYTITVLNSGPSAAGGAKFTDPAVTGLTATNVTCGGTSGGAICPTAGNTTVALMQGAGIVIPTLPSGGMLIFTVTANVTATSGTVTNVATITAPAGTTDPTPANNTDDDADPVNPVADLSITKTDGVSTVNANGTTTYTIVVNNAGPSAAGGAIFTDPAVTGLTATAVTCGSVAGGAVCPTAGNTTVALMQGAGIVIPTLPSGGSLTFTVTATVTALSGTITNTANIAPPAGTTDPNNANNSASDTDNVTQVCDLAITKTDGVASVNANGTTTYTIVVTNNGPSGANGAVFRDPTATGINATAVTCGSAGGGAACPSAGNTTVALMQGSGIVIPTLPNGGTVTFTVTATITATSGSVTNTATINEPAGAIDPNAANDSASDTDTVNPVADLSITKTDGTATYTPGGTTTYTIVVTNLGPSAVTGATVTDTFPAAITSASWMCVASAGSACGAANGTGNISTTANLLVNGTATYTVTANIAANASGNLVNTASVAVPAGTTDPTPGNNSATDTDTSNPTADLAITKTDGSATYTPGGTTTYTIVVTNNGPSNVANAPVADTFPAAITSANWTCTASAGSSCAAANGTGNINSTVSLLVNGTATYTVTANISAGASGNLTNTATVAAPAGVTDPTPGNNSATDTDTNNPQADLSITKTDGTATATPGSTTTYTIVVTNSGPSNVVNAPVTDSFPAAITSASWTCTASAGSSCAAANGTGNINSSVNLLSGGMATYTVTANISPNATGTLTNTANVAAPAGVTDPNLANNSATDTDTLNPSADLAITKTDGTGTYTPGGTTTYTIVVTNNGPSAVTNASVADTFPAAITSASWTCAASPGGICNSSSGTGNITATVTLPPSGTATFTVIANISPNATGNLVNTATVTVPAGVTDPTPGNNSATDTDTPTPTSDLAITKTDGTGSYTPGGSTTYTIVVTNNGPSAVANAAVADTLPAAITSASWTCTASAGSSCAAANGTGNINTTVSLLLNGTATYTVTAQISPSASGSLSNTATVTAPAGTTDPTPGNNSATDTDSANPQADLSITKTDGSAIYTPGGSTTYTIVVTNAGPSAVTGAAITDNFPAAITGATWTCTASAGSACGVANGTGSINTTANLAVNGTATYTVTATISPSAALPLVNTATVAAPAGVTDPNTGNNSATDTDTPVPQADLSVSKTDGVGTYTPGGSTTYTIVVTNNGPSFVTGAQVVDNLPAAITSATWTCVAAGVGSSCGAANGNGSINTTVNLAVNGTATYTVTAQISASATGNLANTVVVSPPAGTTDPTPGNNSATDSDTPNPQADLSITKTDGVATYTPGGSTTYTIVVSNAGPSAVANAPVTDTFPAAITSATWTCTASIGSACGAANGSGNIASTVSLLPGGTATYTVTAQISAGASGALTNTATVAAPAGTTDPTPGNNSATDTDSAVPVADLMVTKTDNSLIYTAGLNTVYTMVVTNNGPSNITGATVTDTLPAGQVNVAGASWTCVATAGSSCGAANGSGNIATTVNLIVGGSATYTYTVPVLAGSVGNLTNTVTVNPPAGATDPNQNNNTATDTDTPFPQADLGITKVSAPATYTPGGTVVWTIVASNNGPSTINGGTVTDLFPAAVTSANWTCSASAGSTCVLPNGNGNINAQVNLLPGGTATFIVTAQINPSATGNLTNTATVTTPPGTTDAVPGNNSATETDTPAPVADLRMSKTDGSATYTPGGSTIYTIVVTNDGPSAVTGAPVTDSLPGAVTSASWTCAASAGSTCTAAAGNGSINTTVSLLPTGTATFTLTVQIASGATGNLVNTAMVTPPAGTTDPNPGNNTATDTDTPAPQADLAITKTDNQTTAVPGQTVTYTIVATNNGPSDVTGAAVADTLPANLSGATWTCAASVGSACGAANGTGNINTTVNLLKAGTATFTLTATISASATGSLTNTATIAPPAGTTDPTPGNNTATDTDTLAPQADLAITKTDGSATYTPGNTVTYTIVATNNGPSVATNALITDTLPAAVTSASWTCTASAGSACGSANGTGNINATATLLVGGTATFTVTAQVSPNATGNLVNTANVAPPQGTTDPNQGNNSATDTDTPNPQADLAITKTDGQTTYTAGLGTTYTIVVTNNGPSSVNNAAVVDNLPAGITSAAWTCVASVNGNCDAANGTGSINTTVDLAPGATATFTVVAQISSTATGNLVNTATVAPPPGTTDPNNGNNTVTDTDTPAPQADLAITKTDGVTAATPGGTTVYTIVAVNNGPSAVTGATVTDTFPAAITSATWTCTGAGGAVCPNANGTGNISQTVNLPVGGSLTYTVTASISPNATGNLTNTATVAVPAGTTDPTPGNNTATDIDVLGPNADIVVQKNGTGIVQVNGAVSYTVEIKNLGPSSANGSVFSDTLPANLVTPTAICTSALAGAVCPAVLNVNAGVVTGTIPTLPPGGNLVITITGFAPATIGTMTNVATVTLPAGVTDPNPGNNTSAAMTQVTNTPVPPVANLAVVKVGPGTVQTNGTITYFVTVTNAGPSAANGASFSDTVPAAITNVSWTCQQAGGAVCPNNNGVGNVIAQTIATFPANGLLTYTVTGTAPASAQTLTNTATITPPAGVTDPDPGDNTSTTTTGVQPTPPTSADLVIAKTGPANVAPNGQMTYTLTVTNKGPAAADGATVSDNIPDVLTNVTATCVATGGAICGSSTVGVNNVLTAVIAKMPVWGIVTYTITATAPQSGSFSNSATVTPPPGVTDPDPGSNTGGPVVTTVGPTVADLAITKTNNATTVVAGAFTTYTVVVTNNGPSAVTNAAVNDNLPAGLVNATWTCQASAGSSCTSALGNGSINTNVSLLSGGTATFIVTAQVLPTATGTLSNTVTVTPPPGVTDPNLNNNTATDGPDIIQQVADLAILKTDNSSTYTPGGQTTYTIVVTNNGPSAVTNAAVADPLPAGITSATWTCSATVGSACGAALGNGSIASTVSLLPGGQAVYTVHALISPSATGNLVNTATITPPQGVTDPNLGNNSSTDTDTPNAIADLVINKTNNAATVTPGGQTTYTITVTNNGPSSVTGAAVNDTLPAALTNATWTCAASAGSACGAANGTGNIATTVSLLPGGTATYTLTATVAVGQTAAVVNTATVTPPAGVTDPNTTNNSSTDVDPVQPVADLALTKTNNQTTVVPGTTTTYQIVVTNSGPSAVTNAQVLDALPAGITSATWTCTASAGSACGAANGTGSINTTVSLLPNGTATYTLIAQVSPNATGILTNTAQVIPPQGTIDPNNSNNTATDSDPLTPQGNLSITKTDGVTTVSTGGQTTYTIVASNSGPSAVIGATVTDNVSSFLTNVTWTCVASAGSSCGAPNGSGSIGTTVNLASGGTATFTLKGTIASSATGTLVNTATITPPNGFTDTNPADNSATDTDTINEIADLSILKTNFVSQLAPGGQTQYTILVSNLGPSNANNAAVVDTPPASLTNVSWTCVASPGSTCAATNGTGAINTTVSLLSGGTATFLLNATVSQTATGTIANTATVTPATVNCRNLGCVTDPNPGNNTSTDTDTVQPTADLAITKTVNVQTVPPGGPLSYVITVRNNGPSNVTGAQVSDTFSTKLTNVSWTCTASSGSACGAASGSGNINTTVDLLVNGSATYVVTANAATTATGSIENVASVTPPAGTTDPNTGNNTTPPVVVVIVPGVDLAIYKTHTGNFQVGQIGTYKISVENVSQFPTTGTITVTDTLPNGLIYQSGTGQGWTCSAAAQIVTCIRNAPLQSGAISEITLRVFVNAPAFPSVINTAAVSTPGDAITSNNTATDPTVVENGQGVFGNPYQPNSPISDQKPGSILIYPVYTSDATGTGQNTRIAITNSDPTRPVAVHLFFVDGSSCAISDSYICLTPQQTTSFLASDIDPGTTGYIVAVAVSSEGCPIFFNELIGDEYVKFASGHQANLGAEAVAALPGLLGQACTLGSGTVPLNFDGVSYNQLPRVLAADHVPSRADGNDTLLIVDRIGGNLATGGSTLGTLFGLVYNDAEVGLSFSISAGGCQYRGSITNNAPRTTPRFEQFIPAGRTGWLKLYSQSSGVGIIGATINHNPNAATSSGAFNQGHDLHKLTLENSSSVLMPVFPPSCL